jgi:hypothetical protein
MGMNSVPGSFLPPRLRTFRTRVGRVGEISLVFQLLLHPEIQPLLREAFMDEFRVRLSRAQSSNQKTNAKCSYGGFHLLLSTLLL